MDEERRLQETVRARYGQAARAVRQRTVRAGAVPGSGEHTDPGVDSPHPNPGTCCGEGETRAAGCLTGDGYSPAELAELPREAVQASLGCANPTALASLQPGEVVLDLGSGGGIDVLLSARRVAPGGWAYGLDMTEEMLDLARDNQQRAGATNATFLRGQMEDIPLPTDHVDVILSNCVINLSTDKDRVLREAFRVLKPGGRLAVADVVFLGRRDRLPAALRQQAELWAGCVAGALETQEYATKLAAAGFVDIAVEPVQVYDPGAALSDACCTDRSLLEQVPMASAFIRARKPAGGGGG